MALQIALPTGDTNTNTISFRLLSALSGNGVSFTGAVYTEPQPGDATLDFMSMLTQMADQYDDVLRKLAD